MYAIIQDGGRQYQVRAGDELDLDYRDVRRGETLEFDQVLAVSDENGFRAGRPTIEGACVSAEVVGVQAGKKVYVQKLRRRKNSRRRTGHRQLYTRVRIEKISS